jgi:protein-L-isoaspartate(D-aspartate) O-methyltransferase
LRIALIIGNAYKTAVPAIKGIGRMPDGASARLAMIQSQVIPNKVTDERVTSALNAVPRENFVPKALRGVAYVDEDLAVGEGRYLMEPMVFARMLQAADIASTDVVLDIGCVTGYSTAVLAQMAATVVAVEENETLAQRANEQLAALEVANAAVITAPLKTGYADQQPYDVIVLNGSVAHIPDMLVDQLAEGGRLVTVLREGVVGRAVLLSREDGVVNKIELFDASVPHLPGFEKEAAFSF